jgi:hypothetical protein
MDLRSEWQLFQVEPGCGDVLAKIARTNEIPGLAQLVEKFSANEVDLTQVGLPRPSSRENPMPGILASMRIAFYSVTFDQSDALF